jgi:hypothetical protein
MIGLMIPIICCCGGVGGVFYYRSGLQTTPVTPLPSADTADTADTAEAKAKAEAEAEAKAKAEAEAKAIRWEYYEYRYFYEGNNFDRTEKDVAGWEEYDQFNNGQIERAYQKYQADASKHNREIEITSQAKYHEPTKNTIINFEYMNWTHRPSRYDYNTLSNTEGPAHRRLDKSIDGADNRRVAYDAGDADAGDARSLSAAQWNALALRGGGEDDADAPVQWEEYYYVCNHPHWSSYPQSINEELEAAYQKYRADPSRHNREIEITVNQGDGEHHYDDQAGQYTVNFEYMYTTSHFFFTGYIDRMDIRRVTGKHAMTPDYMRCHDPPTRPAPSAAELSNISGDGELSAEEMLRHHLAGDDSLSSSEMIRTLFGHNK